MNDAEFLAFVRAGGGFRGGFQGGLRKAKGKGKEKCKGRNDHRGDPHHAAQEISGASIAAV